MARFRMRKRSSASSAWRTTGRLLIDALRFVSLGFRSRSRLAAENLFLRKQLALYAERRVRSRRGDDTTRLTLVVLSGLIDWRAALIIVKPATLIRLWSAIISSATEFGPNSASEHRRTAPQLAGTMSYTAHAIRC